LKEAFRHLVIEQGDALLLLRLVIEVSPEVAPLRLVDGGHARGGGSD